VMRDQRERRFWQRLRKHLSPKVFVRRIENGVSAGDPDVFLMKGGKVIWIELKWAEQPARPSSKLLGKDDVRIDQINWHLEYASKGGTSFILIGTYEMDYLMSGHIAHILSSKTPEEMTSHAIVARQQIGQVLEDTLWP
jgi:hypothetical protein